MINVMIVDDEPKVREGLKALIPWEECGYAVLATASNGYEALQLYHEVKPDLVVADIRMPGMDGLTLIQQLRQLDERLHVLILSGYADFEYAKKAIASRADGYLLKPVDEDEMIGYLKHIKKECAKERDIASWSTVAGRWTRDQLVLSLLEQSTEDEAGQLAAKAKQLGLDWQEYQVLRYELYRADGYKTEATDITEAVKRIDHYVERNELGISFNQQGDTGILLKKTVVGEQMRKELGLELNKLLAGTGLSLMAAAGPLVRKPSAIWRSGERAGELLQQRFFAGEDDILSEETDKQAVYAQQGIAEHPERMEDRLYYALEMANRPMLEELVLQAGEFFAASRAPEQDVKRFFAELTASLLSRLAAHHGELNGCLKSSTDSIALIYQQQTMRLLCRHVIGLLASVSEPLAERTQEHDMKAILDIIHRNFSDNVKLETLAAVFNYNPAYLGKMFKNTTGEYFNTYLDKVRIEHAKQYLQQGMKVYQVAEKVGYTHVDYFHGKFKKYVGISPSSYRKGEQRQPKSNE
ncbi:response regulator transcription factor [Paenibacillus protaetiae]|uniref:Response regulator transcription factor n=1 Tax=Paenibacillus protaetiae TaxID=2509456 RepID=A0A4P6EUN2_9BACL|nr:response regulator transcription factor [Paenibacillus protaetiae]QAY66654.1 response regulator transcription factor [Paenibacillus protaetiae]